MNRDEYLLKLGDRRTRLALVLDELGLSLKRDADLKRQVGGGWTLGEHLVHIAAWERRYARGVSRADKLPAHAGKRTRPGIKSRSDDGPRLDESQRSVDPRSYPSNWQKFNDAVHAEWHGVSPSRARAEYESAHRELVDAISALPPQGDPARPRLFEGFELGAVISHYREHATILLLHAGKPKPPVWRGRVA